MKQRLNYTGRKKIERKYVLITLLKKAGRPLTFEIRLDLSGYNFPSESKVSLEAYDSNSMKVFDLGETGGLKESYRYELTDILREDAISFRLKVIDTTQKHGKILAVANNLVTREPREPHSIMAVASKDLGNRIWEIEFPESSQGTLALFINNKIEGNRLWDMVKNNDIFFTLVYPAVVREIMQRILFIEKIYDTEGEDWENLWLKYIVEECGASPPEEKWSDMVDEYSDDINDWIENEAVESFCREFSVKSKLEQSLGDL